MKAVKFRKFCSLVLLALMALFFLNDAAATSLPQTPPDTSDEEQQQLELCFIYSNLLGCNFPSISNPRLYENLHEWMGTPYKYAGHSKKGIDCSGLVCRLVSDSYNLPLEGTSKELYKKTVPVKRKELREGDLVFFKIRKGRISHVGIYLGENKFAHASTKLGVIVSDLNEPYYEKHYYSAGRLKDN